MTRFDALRVWHSLHIRWYDSNFWANQNPIEAMELCRCCRCSTILNAGSNNLHRSFKPHQVSDTLGRRRNGRLLSSLLGRALLESSVQLGLSSANLLTIGSRARSATQVCEGASCCPRVWTTKSERRWTRMIKFMPHQSTEDYLKVQNSSILISTLNPKPKLGFLSRTKFNLMPVWLSNMDPEKPRGTHSFRATIFSVQPFSLNDFGYGVNRNCEFATSANTMLSEGYYLWRMPATLLSRRDTSLHT